MTAGKIVIAVSLFIGLLSSCDSTREQTNQIQFWKAPDTIALQSSPNAAAIRYGRDLIAYTSEYLGPSGSVASISNGMNCQNCHNDAGTKTFGLNYGAVAATYPQTRARSNTSTSITMRINECIERSLNGHALDSTSAEIQAMKSYIQWLGSNVPKGKRPDGSGLRRLVELERAADPVKGLVVYQKECTTCHGANGEGLKTATAKGFVYPPLWGPNSYNDGAGLYRLGSFAAFARYNMPLGTTYEMPKLTEEQAWDVAAYVNSQPRPHKDQSKDWPVVAKKPLDHPFGPFADPFSENQHKFGPYVPIRKYLDSIQNQSK